MERSKQILELSLPGRKVEMHSRAAMLSHTALRMILHKILASLNESYEAFLFVNDFIDALGVFS